VPYLSGERAPLWNAGVRGLLLGLAAEHGPAEIARAVLTGTLLSARHVLEVVEAATGGRIQEIEFAGRGAGDPAWEALALEALGARVRFHSDPDLSARGAAMLAAIMTGAGPGEAGARLGDMTRTAAPSEAERARGKRLSERYRRASDAALAWLETLGGGDAVAALVVYGVDVPGIGWTVTSRSRSSSPGTAPASRARSIPPSAAISTTGSGTTICAAALTAQNSRRNGRSRWSTCSWVQSTRVTSAKSAAAAGGA
jgi:hypothetical protein